MVLSKSSASLLLAASLAFGGGPAVAQTPPLYWQCVAPSSTSPQGNFCPASTPYPVPMIQSIADAVAITKSDSTVYSPPLRAIYVGDGSACAVTLSPASGGSDVVFSSEQPGATIPVAALKVKAATTCTTLVGLR